MTNRRVSVAERTKLLWTPWRKDNTVSFETNISGVGRGEQKMVEEFRIIGAEVKLHGGYEHSYDILDNFGLKWEVKEVDANLEIRPGKDGIRSADTLIDVLRGVFDSMHEILQQKDLFEDQPREIECLRDFIHRGKLKVHEGSIPKGLIFGKTNDNPKGLVAFIQDISSIINKHDFRGGRLDLHFADGASTPTRHTTQIDIVDLLNIFPAFSPAYVLSPFEKMISKIKKSSFMSYILNPNLITELWNSSSLPSYAFKYVDGLLFVNEFDGYAVLNINKIDEFLIFERISAGKSKFKIIQKEKPIKQKVKIFKQTEFDFLKDM